MSNKKLAIVLTVVAVLVVGLFGIAKFGGRITAELNENEGTSQSNTTQKPTTNQPLTKTEVAKHNSKNDCWTIISGQVYDITSYVSSHPGGDEILRACGIDGTSLFTKRQTSSGQTVGSGTPHDRSSTQQLQDYRLGDLLP